MDKNPLQSLIEKEMTRKEFLTFAGIAIASVFGFAGVWRELKSHAATLSASVEPEKGALSGGTTVVTDTAASGGQAVTFGGSTPPPVTPPPTPSSGLPLYGATGTGTAKTSDATVTVPAGGNVQTVINNASTGAVICVSAADYSTATLTVNKAITVRATGTVKIKNAVVSGGATFEGFTIVGGTAGAPAKGIDVTGTNCTIRNNLINGHGIQIGIYAGGSGHVIDHNTIHRINNYGIQTAGGSSGMTISRNNIFDLYDTVGNGFDVDGARIFGTNMMIRENYIHDIYWVHSTASRPHADCFQNYQGSNLVADNNTYENNYGVRVTGMFIITSCQTSTTRTLSNYTIRGNVAETYSWQSIKLSGIAGAIVENNTLFGAPQGRGPVITAENDPTSGALSSNIRVQNNVLVYANTTSTGLGSLISGPTDGVTVNRNNVVGRDPRLVTAMNDAEGSPPHCTTPIITSDFTDWRTRELAFGSLSNAGAPLLSSGFTKDIAGNARVQGSAIDIGAYEFA